MQPVAALKFVTRTVFFFVFLPLLQAKLSFPLLAGEESPDSIEQRTGEEPGGAKSINRKCHRK